MPRTPNEIVIDAATAQLIAALSTIVAGNLMAMLANKGLIARADIAEVVEMVRVGGLDDDPGLTALSAAMADMLSQWVNTATGGH